MKSCCFIGHRMITRTEELCYFIQKTVKILIEEFGVQIFYFGGDGRFDSLCYELVYPLQETEYPQIELWYIRAKKRYLTREQSRIVADFFDGTLMPCGVEKAGKAAYVERNQAMIDASDFCVFYYDKNYQPMVRQKEKDGSITAKPRKSGTRLAYEYAKKKNKPVINVF